MARVATYAHSKATNLKPRCQRCTDGSALSNRSRPNIQRDSQVKTGRQM